jgi:CBS domain containing-hemolysin-like protein
MKKDNWIIKAFLMTFFIALIFNAAANVVINNCNYIALILVCILFVLLGIIFDIIGTAVLTAKESTFHAKSSKKIKGAKESIYLIKNSNQIASICNDVIGDICGIVSGSVGAMLSIFISQVTKIDQIYCTLIISSLISSLTVGGKAIGKKYAVEKSDIIIEKVGKVLSIFIKNKKSH